MYLNSLVMAVKVNNKVLREFADNTVYIPFGSEYSLYFKNYDSQRSVKIYVYIDGDDALDGTGLIVRPNESLDLKRFIKNGNMNQGHSFKFIEKTEKISNHRGNKAEDGLIRIEFEYENSFRPNYFRSDWVWQANDSSQYTPYTPTVGFPQIGGVPTSVTRGYDFNNPTLSSSTAATNYTATNDAGITAPGSVNNQKFTSTSFYGDGIVYSMTMQLKGGIGEKKVETAVEVKKHTECVMCGTSVKQTAKFCHECGASVIII